MQASSAQATEATSSTPIASAFALPRALPRERAATRVATRELKGSDGG
jgi:hypothetical protein